MRRFLFFSFLVLTSFQCFPTVEYDGSRRIQVSGKIIDEDGVPLSSISFMLVGVVGDKEEGGTDIISSGISQSNGNLDFVIADNDAKIYKLLINRQFDLVGVNNFPVKTDVRFSSLSVDIDPSVVQNFEMDLGNITIKDGTQLSLSCQTNASEIISDIEINTSDTLAIGKPNINQKREFHLDFYTQVCGSQSDILQVSKNSRVLLAYLKENEFIYDTISIGENPVNYIF